MLDHESGDRHLNANLIAGMLSGVAGLLVFLTIHHFWIKPIWFIAPVGLIIAALGGLAVGWSYSLIRLGLPSRPWTTLAMVALIGATLLPAILLAQLRPSPVDFATFTIPPENTGTAIRIALLELFLPAILIGGIAGWLIGHSWQAALATALAGLIFALGPGHNVPFLGNTPVTGKGLILLAAIVVVSSLVLVETSALLAER
jgi:hypothetical protein